MGRTNVVINDQLIEKVIQITGVKTKREAVDIALRRLVDQSVFQKTLQKARGGLQWEGDLKNWRKRRR